MCDHRKYPTFLLISRNNMNNKETFFKVGFIHKIKAYVIRHKIIAGVAFVVFFGAMYFGYVSFFGATTETRYVVAMAEKGALVASISGTGQISATHQVELKTKVSGDIVSVGVIAGQDVGVGTLIAQIDASNAQKSVRDAEANLKS